MGKAGAAAIGHGARHHRSAGAEDGGDVQPGGGHEQAGDVLVAVGDHYQAVELVGQGHGLGGVGDQLPGDQGVFHAHVAHGDAVADGNGGEFDGGASGQADAGLHRLANFIQVHVPRYDLVLGADYADEGALQLLLGVAQGVEEGAVGGALSALGHIVASHGAVPP